MSVASFNKLVNFISMYRSVLQSAASYGALPFGTLSYKRHEFRRRFIEYKLCVPIFCTVLSVKFLILRRFERGIVIIVNRFSNKLIIFFSEFIHTWNCRQIFEVLKIKFYENSSIVSWVLPSSQTNGRTVNRLT